MPKSWQVIAMIDMIHNKKNGVILAGTCSGKSLPYQLIPLIKDGVIVLDVLLIIILITDHVCFYLLLLVLVLIIA